MRKRILVVDDDLLTSKVVAQILTRLGGYETRVENSAERGLSSALEFRPDLVVMDYRMPEMTGDEVLNQLRDHPTLQSIPAILLSGDYNLNSIDQDPMTLLVRKPVTGDSLVQTAKVLLGENAGAASSAV